MPTIVELDGEGETMWRQVIAAWADQAAHDRFIQYCFKAGCLAAAGARYRMWLDERGTQVPAGDVEQARQMQARVVFLSMQHLGTPSGRRPSTPLVASPWFVAIVMMGAVVGAIFGLFCGKAP